MDLTRTKDEKEKTGSLGKTGDYIEPEMAGVKKGKNGEEIVDLDYVPSPRRCPQRPLKRTSGGRIKAKNPRKQSARKGSAKTGPFCVVNPSFKNKV